MKKEPRYRQGRVTKKLIYSHGSCSYHLVTCGMLQFAAKFSKSHVSAWDGGWKEIVRTPKVGLAELVELYVITVGAK